MEFNKSKIDFQEADRRYAELKRQQDVGTIDDEEYDARLKELMVLDDEDRWWVKSRKTGEWHYNNGNAWVRGTPPGYQMPPTAQHQPGEQGSPPIKPRWVAWTAIFAVLALVVGVAWYQMQPEMVRVPSVLDKPPAEAKEILGSRDFKVKVEPDKWATEWPDGVVVAEQSPLEGEIEKGSTVIITLDYPDQSDKQDYSN